MDDFSIDADFPTSPSESTLDALYTPDPPSPILTPSQLTFAWSSGDIPVFLYDDGYVEAAPEMNASLSVSCIHQLRDSSTNLPRTPPVNARASPSSDSSTDAGSTLSENFGSSESLSSVGTFGPRHGRRTLRASHVSQHTRGSRLLNMPSSASTNPRLPVTSQKRTSLSGQISEENPGSSSRAPSKVFYHPIVYVEDVNPTSSNNSPTRDSIEPDCQHDSSVELRDLSDDSDTGTVVNNDTEDKAFIPNRKTAVSWISSRSWDYTQYKDFVASQESSRRPKVITGLDNPGTNESWRTSPEPRDLEETSNETSQEMHIGGHHLTDLDSRHLHDHLQDQLLKESIKIPSPKPLLRLQLEHDWLEDICVDFLIDQEGFRAAHPSFVFTGLVRLRLPNIPGAAVNIFAQFKPVTRQVFHFHYSPFETPPILRRITVNRDDTHDYLSKQGLLVLKANGVYVLQGHEFPAGGHHHHDADTSKLHWQLEYLVDDRLTDASGRLMEGEKNLAPLTFLCTPALLLPTQAKKNSIMHVLKKGVAPKLQSEKLQPRTMQKFVDSSGKGSNSNSSSPTTSPTGTHFSHFLSSISQGKTFHRRGESQGGRHIHTMPQTIRPPLPRQPIQRWEGPGLGANSDEPVEFERNFLSPQRRNSSAGEHNDSPIKLHFNTIGPSNHNHLRVETSNLVHTAQIQKAPTRHIIPPAKLAELLDSSEKENVARQSTLQSIISNPRTSFAPLAPRPRRNDVKVRNTPRV